MLQKDLEEEIAAARLKVEKACNKFELEKAQGILQSLEDERKVTRLQAGMSL